MVAAATVFGINAWVDTLAVADDAVLAALALSVDAVIPRRADVAASAAVIGVGINVGTHSTATDFVGLTEAPVPMLTVMKPFLKQTAGVHPAAEAREKQMPIMAEVVARGLLIGGPFVISRVLAMGDITAGRGSVRSAK